MSAQDPVSVSKPFIGFCEEKFRLLAEFEEAVAEINLLHSEQMRAVIEDDPEFSRFDVLVHMAQDRKARVKYALLTHLVEHGCISGK
ncbi:MAG TPA: hypothetical protein VK789_22505 [Bryobacteraceae bacterium]|jgi:hypothetical protein|nr:hypothetical protein [Bryobacteraceae bacterium]